ncbi:transposase [Gottfriedia acidiceleris]|uniref:transposase n=1 Tax=Gottfriedia acidiceleris TaxID=371036 RepID=UPI000B435B20|nr:transposase [Gottfriedia acidiceleris]
MGKIKKTYSKEIKVKAIDLYFKKDMGIRSIAKELGIGFATIQRWITHYKREGIQGLDEKRGTSDSLLRRKAKIDNESNTEKINRLEAENAFLKKLLAAKRGLVKEGKNH